MSRTTAAALVLLLSSCVSVSAIPRFGRLDLDGEVGINDASSGSSASNSISDTGLDDDRSVPGARVDLEAAGMTTTFQLSSSSHGGTGTLTADLDDGTTSIPAGSTVRSDLDLLLGEAIVTWDFVPGDTVELGLGFGATLFDVDAQFQDTGSGDTISTDEVLPLPLLAARVGVALGDFDVSLLAGGFAIEIDDDDATFVDVDLMARWKVFGAAGRRVGAIVLGYRHVELDLDYDDDDAAVELDLELSGPYLGFSLGF